MISLKDVTRVYRAGDVEIPVLRGIDLEVEDGEYVAIMGRSGAGKSTLMNILGCLDRPTSGTYELGGREVGSLPDDALSEIRGNEIGFVFQSFHLLRNLAVRENVELPMEYRGVGRGERRARAEDLLERVGLGHRTEHLPRQLSGGERQRVAIARALVNRPSLLLADEPTGNLDSTVQESILGLFADLQRETGVTLLVVTHDRTIGEAADRRVVVSDGRVDEGSGRISAW